MLDLPVLSVMALIHPDQQTNNTHPLLLERLLVMYASSVQLYCTLCPHSYSSLSAQVKIWWGTPTHALTGGGLAGGREPPPTRVQWLSPETDQYLHSLLTCMCTGDS